jgi:hypothetical protein
LIVNTAQPIQPDLVFKSNSRHIIDIFSNN